MYLILLSVKEGGIKYHFKVFGMTQPGIEPRSPGPIGEHSTHYANEPVLHINSHNINSCLKVKMLCHYTLSDIICKDKRNELLIAKLLLAKKITNVSDIMPHPVYRTI